MTRTQGDVPEEHEDTMSNLPPPSTNDLEPSVSVRGVEFELRGQLKDTEGQPCSRTPVLKRTHHGEKQNLDGRTGAVPPRAGDTELIGHGTTLQLYR